MAIWSAEIKELEKLYDSVKGQFPALEKELGHLIKTDDDNVIMLYSRRCLEVIITDLCECELNRERGSEPLKGVIDKLKKEKKIPSHIASSMYSLNDLSTYGTHPKDFDPEQVKPVLNNLDIIIKWYLKYKDTGADVRAKTTEETGQEIKSTEDAKKDITISRKRLAGILGGSLAIIASVFAVLYFSNIIGSGKQIKELEKSIAVLPFINDSPDTTNTYFINGIMERITTNLQMIKELRVISRTSVEQYRNNKTKSIPEIAKELDVNYIIEGSGQRYGNSCSVTTQLIKAKGKETHLWAKTYDQEIKDAKDIFRIQRQIAQAIAGELKAVITPQEKQLIEKMPTTELAAYDAYLRGQFYLNKWDLNYLDTAMYYFELAKEKDPEYALAYAGISDVWILRQQFLLISHTEAEAKAIPFFTKALELDSTRAEIYYSLGFMKQFLMWDWKGSETAYQKAIALNPNYSLAHVYYSNLLSLLGRHKEAIEQIELALKLDPQNSLPKACYGVSLIFVHRYNDAIKTFQDALKINPTNNIALANVHLALHMTGRYDEALESWKSFYSNSYKDIAHAFDQGYKKAGYIGALTLEADTLVAQSKTSFIWPSDIYLLYILIGNKDRALEWMKKSYEAHENMNIYLLFPPIYDSMRNEPRYQELCRKMNLPFK